MNSLEIKQLIKDWIPPEASVALALKDQYIEYSSGMYDIQIRPGQRVPSGSITDHVYKQGGRIESLVDESVFGIPYYGILEF
jgi:two-component system, LytTR family, response regulator LytT